MRAQMPLKKFNEETCQIIVENYSKGLPITDCAAIAGIDRRTIYRWMEKGKNSKRGKYNDFYKAMQRARAKFKAHHLQKIANSKHWTASQYLLQCVDPGEFVIAEKQKIEAQIDQQVQHKGFENLIEAFDASKREWDKHKQRE